MQLAIPQSRSSRPLSPAFRVLPSCKRCRGAAPTPAVQRAHNACIVAGMSVALLLANAFLLGLAHALEPDHVTAVSTFLSRYPGRVRAIRFCVQWGVGHMFPLLGAAVAAATVGAALPVRVAGYAERGVGAMLVLLGAWVLWEVWRGRIHSHLHEHDGVVHSHFHAHPHADFSAHAHAEHVHAHGAFLVGVVHGFAGSAAVIVLALAAGASSLWLSGAYVATFSSGVIVAMAAYGWSAGALLERIAIRRSASLRFVQVATGSCSLLLGAYWLSRAVTAG
jgi:ABC-type nickel/cobalt efflux system permease component RcnA